jgi:hypothetical protein
MNVTVLCSVVPEVQTFPLSHDEAVMFLQVMYNLLLEWTEYKGQILFLKILKTAHLDSAGVISEV